MQEDTIPTKNIILRLPKVCERTGLSRSAIYKYVALGRFPAPRALTDRSVGWLESDIERWINEREKKFHLGA